MDLPGGPCPRETSARDRRRAHCEARATVVRRLNRKVPHNSAATWEDAIFLQGYVTAQDRMWQMDALRRLAAGELANLWGPSAVEQDRESRAAHGTHYRSADKNVGARSENHNPAYARGVNYYLGNRIEAACPRIHAAELHSPRLANRRYSLAALQMYHARSQHLAGRNPQAAHACGRRCAEGEFHSIRIAREPRRLGIRTPGRFPERTLPAAKHRFWRAIRTWNGRFPSPWYRGAPESRGPGRRAWARRFLEIPAVIHQDTIRNLAPAGVTNLRIRRQDLCRETIDRRARAVSRWQGQTKQGLLDRDWIG